MPRITVLMPVYNGMPYIPEAVESVLSQSLADWELVISDNGSTDATRDYLDTLSDPRIRVFKQDSNLGIFGNLNFLLGKASSPIAKILCSDDALLEGGLERIARFMEERPACAVSRCWAAGNSEYFASGRAGDEGALPPHLSPPAAALAFATFGNLVGNLSKAACRPKLVLEAGGFDQQYPYAGDYEGWMRIARRHGIDLQNEELVFERQHEQQNSNLLNRKNELFPQINALLTMMSTHVAERDRRTLKRHWTVHFLSRRVPRFMQQLKAGHYEVAFRAWKDLPLGISPAACILAYPLVKLDLGIAHRTTRALCDRIVAVNEASDAR
jgi:glycosyltransferase involved in cell wall biosynthesis